MLINNELLEEIEYFVIESSQKELTEVNKNNLIIFELVNRLKIEYEDSNVLIVVFDNSIKFISPLFLIQILNYQYLSKKRLALDISHTRSSVQYATYNFLYTYNELNFITLNKSTFNLEKIIERHTNLYSAAQRGEENIFLHYSVPFKKETYDINSTTRKFPPIIKLSNFYSDFEKRLDRDLATSNVATHEYIGEKDHIFQKFALDINLEYTKLKKSITDLFINMYGSYSNSNEIIDVLFEIFQNIEKHTSKKNNNLIETIANAYFSFHRNSSDKENIKYEIYISDDYEGGLLNTYFYTVEKELAKLEKNIKKYKKTIDSQIEKAFNTTLSLLEDNIVGDKKNGDIRLLEQLYSIENQIEMSTIRRIIMHFGLPKLIRIIMKLNGELYIYTNRNGRYYHISIINGEANVNSFEYGMNGTHYHIVLPEIHDTDFIPTTHLHNSDYQQLLNAKKPLEVLLEKFIPVKEGAGFLDGKPRKFDYKQYIIEKSLDNFTVSNFIRDVLLYAYLHETKDILITSFPVKKYKSYLFDLIVFLYDEKLIDELSTINPVNMLFVDDKSTASFFIGGKTKEDLYAANKTILINNEYNILPISYISSDILKDQINTHLTSYKNFLDIHLDTKRGYHVQGFYKFKDIFTDSSFAQPIAMHILSELEEMIDENINNILIIGTDPYAELVCSFLYFGKTEFDNITSKIEQPIILEFSKTDNCNLIEKLDISKYDLILFYSPVVFSGKDIESYHTLVDKAKNVLWYSTVKLGGINPKIHLNYSLLSLSIEHQKIHKTTDDKYCEICSNDVFRGLYNFSHNPPVLYELTESNHYELKNFYEESYLPKKNSAYIPNFLELNWLNSIDYLHIERGSNHYTFYIDTVSFLEDNTTKVKSYLNYINKKIKNMIEDKSIVILSPRHNSNNRFSTLVHDIVFNEERRQIIQLSLDDHEQNYYSLERLRKIYSENPEIQVYFVDDSIASTSTLEYFYSILKTIDSELKFQKAIVMIDRSNKFDRDVLKDYFDEPNNSICSFYNLEIKPIKTFRDNNNCFLCERQNDYQDYLNSSVLDMNRYQSAYRVSKLNIKSHISEKQTSYNNKIKNIIKMYAVQHLNISCNRISTDFSNIKKLFLDNIQKYFSENFAYYFGRQDEIFKSIFLTIIDHESNIALLKALTFPRIIYFMSVRDIATKEIIKLINNEINKLEKVSYSYQFIFDNLENDLDNVNSQELRVFLKDYIHLSSYDKISFLYRVSGYLNIVSILDKKHIDFFYQSTCAIKTIKPLTDLRKYKYSVLHSYAFAAKMVSSYDTHQSRYFEKELSEFKKAHKDYDSSDYTLVHSLDIENNNLLDNDVIKKDIKDISAKHVLPLDKKMELLKTKILSYLEKKSLKCQIESIYINERFNIDYNKYDNSDMYKENDVYKTYIIESKLVDILNNFERYDKIKNSMVQIIFNGAVTEKRDDNSIRHIETTDIHTVHSLWSNILIDKFVLNNNKTKKCTLIKLLSVDTKMLQKCSSGLTNKVKSNNPIWLKPIGCMVISHTYDYEKHVELSKYILAIQGDIVSLLKKEFSHGSISEGIETNKYRNYISRYSHNISPILDIGEDFEAKLYSNLKYVDIKDNGTYEKNSFDSNEDLNIPKDFIRDMDVFKNYMYGVPKIARVAQLQHEVYDEEITTDIEQLLESEKNNILDSIRAMSVLNTKSKINNCNYEIEINPSETPFVLKKILKYDVLSILFELCYNAAKYNKLNEHAVCIIKFYIENDSLKITNTWNKQILKDKRKPKIGQESIRKALDKLNYKIKYDDSNSGLYSVTIKRKQHG